MKKLLDKFDYKVEYKGNSFIETIFFAIVLIVIIFFIFITDSKAASVPIEYFEFSFGGAHYPEFPINWSISKNDSGSKQLSIIGEGSEISKYSYAVLEICSNNKLEIEVTGGCTSSCFTRGDAYIYHTSKPCKAMNLNGTISYYEIRFETFQKNINDSAQYKIVSPMSFKNKNDSIAAVRLNGITLADYDMLSEKIENQENFDKLDKNQQQTNDKLDQAEETRKGIWGTIKSIFSKIGDLPGLIWNAIKGGFEAITNGITNLFNFFQDDDIGENNSFFDNFNDEDHGGISGVVTAPLSFIRKMSSTCSPLNIDVLGADVSLPCGDELFWNKEGVSSFRIIWNSLVGGVLVYSLVRKLFKTIENMKDPNNSKVEVMKL